jgi:hypothetical protein
MVIRNYGEDKEGLKEIRGSAKEKQRRPSQVGVPIQVELESNSDSRNSRHQNRHPDLDVLYIDGKLRGSTFQWNRSHIQIPSEST